MRIGILLKSFNETMGGIGVYTQEITRALLQVDCTNEYVLIFPDLVSRARVAASFAAIKMR